MTSTFYAVGTQIWERREYSKGEHPFGYDSSEHFVTQFNTEREVRQFLKLKKQRYRFEVI